MDVRLIENSVDTLIGLKISILKKSKSGLVNYVRIINGLNNNNFFAIFNEEDVDFQLKIDNQLCARGIRFTLSINNKSYPYYIRPGKVSIMETLESNGRKLHFKSQNTEEGQLLVAATADKYGISFDEAANNCSKITFRIDVEKLIEKLPQELITSFQDLNIIGEKICVKIQNLSGETTDIDIGSDNTVFDLKTKFTEKVGTLMNHMLIFNGKELDCHKTLRECGIKKGSLLYVIHNPEFNPNRVRETNRSIPFLSGNQTPNDIPPTSYGGFTFGSINQNNSLSRGNQTPNDIPPTSYGSFTFGSINQNNSLSRENREVIYSDSRPFKTSLHQTSLHQQNTGPLFGGASQTFGSSSSSRSSLFASNPSPMPQSLSLPSFSFGGPPQKTVLSNNEPFFRESRKSSPQYGAQSQLQVFSGERGVICFGDKSDQKFTPYNRFTQDFNLLINPFTIEMRMASKYDPI